MRVRRKSREQLRLRRPRPLNGCDLDGTICWHCISRAVKHAAVGAAPGVAAWSGYVAEVAGAAALITAGVPVVGEAFAGVAGTAAMMHLAASMVVVASHPTKANKENLATDFVLTFGGLGGARAVRNAPRSTKTAFDAVAFLVGIVASHSEPAVPMHHRN